MKVAIAPDGALTTEAAPALVYFVWSPNDNEIKIGVSTEPERRLKEIALTDRWGGGARLVFLCHGGYRAEKLLHQHFRRLRRSGEWFAVGREVVDFLKTNQSAFDAFPQLGQREHVVWFQAAVGLTEFFAIQDLWERHPKARTLSELVALLDGKDPENLVFPVAS